MYKILTSTRDEYENRFFTDQREKESQLIGDHQAAQKGYVHIMIKMKYLFGFLIDLEKIIYGIGFKLILNENNIDRALFTVNAGAGTVANDCNKKIGDVT